MHVPHDRPGLTQLSMAPKARRGLVWKGGEQEAPEMNAWARQIRRDYLGSSQARTSAGFKVIVGEKQSNLGCRIRKGFDLPAQRRDGLVWNGANSFLQLTRESRSCDTGTRGGSLVQKLRENAPRSPLSNNPTLPHWRKSTAYVSQLDIPTLTYTQDCSIDARYTDTCQREHRNKRKKSGNVLAVLRSFGDSQLSDSPVSSRDSHGKKRVRFKGVPPSRLDDDSCSVGAAKSIGSISYASWGSFGRTPTPHPAPPQSSDSLSAGSGSLLSASTAPFSDYHPRAASGGHGPIASDDSGGDVGPIRGSSRAVPSLPTPPRKSREEENAAIRHMDENADWLGEESCDGEMGARAGVGAPRKARETRGAKYSTVGLEVSGLAFADSECKEDGSEGLDRDQRGGLFCTNQGGEDTGALGVDDCLEGGLLSAKAAEFPVANADGSTGQEGFLDSQLSLSLPSPLACPPRTDGWSLFRRHRARLSAAVDASHVRDSVHPKQGKACNLPQPSPSCTYSPAGSFYPAGSFNEHFLRGDSDDSEGEELRRWLESDGGADARSGGSEDGGDISEEQPESWSSPLLTLDPSPLPCMEAGGAEGMGERPEAYCTPGPGAELECSQAYGENGAKQDESLESSTGGEESVDGVSFGGRVCDDVEENQGADDSMEGDSISSSLASLGEAETAKRLRGGVEILCCGGAMWNRDGSGCCSPSGVGLGAEEGSSEELRNWERRSAWLKGDSGVRAVHEGKAGDGEGDGAKRKTCKREPSSGTEGCGGAQPLQLRPKLKKKTLGVKRRMSTQLIPGWGGSQRAVSSLSLSGKVAATNLRDIGSMESS